MERVGANVVQFRVPEQDEKVLRSLGSSIRIAGVYRERDSCGESLSSNDFVFEYVPHPSGGRLCVFCQVDVDGSHDEVDEDTDEVNSFEVIEKLSNMEEVDHFEMVPRQHGAGECNEDLPAELLELFHTLPPVYSLAEVLARADVNIHEPDRTGVLQCVWANILSLNKVMIDYGYFIMAFPNDLCYF